MKRIIGIICAFGAVGLMLLADSLESSSMAFLGSILWMIAIVMGAVVVAWQANRARVTPVIGVVAFIPFLNLLLIPLLTIILSLLPDKKK